MNNFQKDFLRARRSYPSLKYSRNKDLKGKTVSGTIDVLDNRSELYSTFEFEMVISKHYPHTFPKVFETGGRIPLLPSRHINGDKTCCLCAEPLQWMEAVKGISILKSLEYVKSFFANQLYFETYMEWPKGEYSHGKVGTLEFFEDLLKTKNPAIISYAFITAIHKLARPNAPCFCGSGKRENDCHYGALKVIESIPTEILLAYNQTLFK